MVGRKEVGAKRGDEMRGFIIVSNAGDMTDCGPAKALHDSFTMGQLGSRGMDEGFRKQMVVSGPVR